MKQRVLSLFLALAVGLSLLSGAAMAAGSPMDETKNIDSTYNGNWAVPVNSYLYQDGENLVRVEHDRGWNMINSNTGEVTVMRPEQLIVQTYSPQFRLLDSCIMELELPLWGGFFAGETYNFCVFGQENPSESDSTEVIRVVKYDKQWNRLGQASLYGANTYIPFEAGSLRMDEYGGYLYIHTSHEMYAGSDGLHHQANLTFSVRESDMEITDSFFGVANSSAGYVSHSFNQFILVDQSANIVTLNHGDAYPRGAVLMRYSAKAGSDKFITANGSYWNAVSEEVLLRDWSGSIGDNTTGAQITGLAETSTGYLVAFSDTGKGSATTIGKDVSNIYLAYTAKDNFTESGTTVRSLTDFTASSSQFGSQPRLVPTGLDGGYILWDVAEKSDNGYFYNNGVLQYARYYADGTISQIQTVEYAPLFNGQPICRDGKVIWYVTDYDAPVFYVLDESGVTAYPTSDSGQELPDDPGDQTAPSFTDVPEGAWYAQYVEKAAQAGLMGGTGDGRFSPEETLSISQVVALCVRLHAQYYGNTVPESVDGPWYQGAYQYGLEQGLFNRSQLSSSIANNPASRLQMVAWLDKAVPESQKQPIHSEVTIPDVAPTDPGGTEIYKWYRAGILEGDSDHRFNGRSSITRAETAAILCRLAGLTPRI
ncbi:S-layer homology domain-containing protein [Pseudoflavonifractor phocaeensis]|uniref:S-layer homology domain-containing protein n=1 Tax=Pseudoflavonifractor phocaeensis TaxID=1870988 RepID=UPI001958CC70|nr:S-layer homology domain-containing protein [Pseudoflavonifractor phocaeensis]MBM6723349.1 S-layer homology domain-containing protein [Pseudoflavonifractor phocaeensis]